MVIIWAVTFTVFLILGFGTTAIALVAIPKNYNINISFDKIHYIEYTNDNTSFHPLFDTFEGGINHTTPMKGILNRIESGGKSNMLTSLFRGNPPTKTVESNNSDTTFLSTFKSAHSKGAIIIWFKTPEYSVENVNASSHYKLTSDTTVARNKYQIHAILIPLNKTSNKFQQQTIFLYPNNPLISSSTQINYKMNTYGNYYKLGKYVQQRLA